MAELNLSKLNHPLSEYFYAAIYRMKAGWAVLAVSRGCSDFVAEGLDRVEAVKLMREFNDTVRAARRLKEARNE